MKILLLIGLLLHVFPVHGIQRLPLSQRTNSALAPIKQASTEPTNHAWKLGLLGLAALGFLIRKRL
jgi:MYXO-CTERM domain-containing protein